MTWFSRGAAAVLVLVLTVVFAEAVAVQALPWREPLAATPERAMITVGEHELEVELAVTSSQQSLGLGYRNGLAEGTGMLFVGDSPSLKSFWMMGMRFCLDIVWVEDGEIVGAAESVCPDPDGIDDAERPRYLSPEPVTHVLEVPAGWLEQNGYGPGTQVQIPDEVLDLVRS